MVNFEDMSFNNIFNKKEEKDLFEFTGTCMRCGAELENEDEQGDCIQCGNMCCFECGSMTEEGLLCEYCKELD